MRCKCGCLMDMVVATRRYELHLCGVCGWWEHRRLS